MRSLTASALRPPTLKESGAGGTQARQHREHKAINPPASLSFPEHWNNPDVRGALYARHGRVCTYCGCSLPRNDKGDVEHFRPKGHVTDDAAHGGYWWLAYELSNYLISCSTCNRVYKKNRFPLRPWARQRVTYQMRQRLSSEPRLLVHPFDIDRRHGPVEEWFQVDWQAHNCFIRPKDGLPPKLRLQVKGTLEFFGINLNGRLLRERNQIREEVIEALNHGDKALAKHYAIRFRPHSLVARQMLADQGRSDLIPTPVEELEWFVGDELNLLETTLALLEQAPGDRSLVSAAQEQRWVLAALWRDPPVGTSSDVERWLPPPVRARLQPFADRFA